MREVWDNWDLRILVLISFVCQYILLTSGKARKRMTFAGPFVWATYLTSDWVLNLSLGIISSKVGEQVGHFGENENNQLLVAFWSTLLLVHIGGPPTITAEALEDNALWPRTVLLGIFQTVRVLYIVLLAWRSKYWLSYFSTGMLVVGFIKCGERAWAQYYASADNGYDINSAKEKYVEVSYLRRNTDSATATASQTDPQHSFGNFRLFFVSLFKDLVLSSDDLRGEQSYFRRLGYKEAFKYVEDQLGYAYDVFYTKAYVMFYPLGRILCACTAAIVTTVFICFCKFKETEMHGISKTDRVITGFLVVGVVFQELYTVEAQLIPTWNNSVRRLSTSTSDNLFDQNWLEIIMNCNLLTFCRKYNSDSWSFKTLELSLETENCEVNENLTKNIYEYFSIESNTDLGRCIGKNRMKFAIEESGLRSIEWTKQLEFHQSILTWHIATELCNQHDTASTVESRVDISKTLSEYMLYLLVKQRHMLPIGRAVIIVPSTCKETSEFFRQAEIQSNDIREACDRLLQFNSNAGSTGRSTSALSDACRLVRSVITEMETVQRWEFLEVVWMEILYYAATECRADQHAQQLRRGGEFLTHVWLLMAHLVLMEQFQVDTETTEQSTDRTNELEEGKNIGTTVNGGLMFQNCFFFFFFSTLSLITFTNLDII